jgi:hypothetical protein
MEQQMDKSTSDSHEARQIHGVRIHHPTGFNFRLQYPSLGGGGVDHWPVQLESNFQTTPKNRPFRFEKFWIEHPTFKENISQWWWDPQPEQGTRMFKLYKKLRYIKHKLKEWNKEIFGNINQEKIIIEDKMRNLQEICIDMGYTKERKKEEI